jgi:hypothetical protein
MSDMAAMPPAPDPNSNQYYGWIEFSRNPDADKGVRQTLAPAGSSSDSADSDDAFYIKGDNGLRVGNLEARLRKDNTVN